MYNVAVKIFYSKNIFSVPGGTQCHLPTALSDCIPERHMRKTETRRQLFLQATTDAMVSFRQLYNETGSSLDLSLGTRTLSGLGTAY